MRYSYRPRLRVSCVQASLYISGLPSKYNVLRKGRGMYSGWGEECIVHGEGNVQWMGRGMYSAWGGDV